MDTQKSVKIPGYESYLLFETGQIINTKTGNFIQHTKRDDGYYVSVGKRGSRKAFKVAKLLAIAYLGDSNNGDCIQFKNGDQYNHTIGNIQWATRTDIVRKRNRMDKNRYSRNVGIKRKPVLQFSKEGTQICEYPSTMAVERMKGFNYNKIGEACRGERKTYKGYIWKYKN